MTIAAQTAQVGQGQVDAIGDVEWERSGEALWRRTAAGVVVLPNDGTAAVSLEGLHAAVWDAFARPMHVRALVDQLGEFLPDDPATSRRVATDAVRFLVANGAVRESLGTPG